MLANTRVYASLLSVLPRIQRYARGPLLRRLYWALFSLWESAGPPVRTTLHGYNVLLNRGNIYPFIIHACPQFNAPLVELVHQMARATNLPLNFVDVGAAIGDAVLLIKERCPGAVGKFICIEGDSEFHELLLENMRQFSDVDVVKCLLAGEAIKIKSLVKHHKGSATATGEEMVDAVCLDSIQLLSQTPVDILKIDVDGFDGEVLCGATETLRSYRPAVIFEWHPTLIIETGNDPLRAFVSLAACGYDRYVWFNNDGTFSHFSGVCSPEVLKKHVDYLLGVNSQKGHHFDIVAVHASSTISEVGLAALTLSQSSSA
jgi:FkbM family methyltransferase